MADEVRLADLCEAIVDCPHSTPVWTDSGAVVLRNQNIRNGRLDLSEPSYTDEAHFIERTRRAMPTEGDLVITREAPMGEVCMIPSGLRCCLGQRMVLLRPNRKRADTRYLLYALQSKAVQHEIGVNEGTGSTVSNLRIPLLESLPIPIPALTEQRAIAHILGTLDNKIEVNRRMNETLEAMSEALFKSWFVDFDPVRARGERRDPGLPKPLADLFPDSFEHSGLGEIPKGWSAIPVYEIATYINGAAYAAFQPNDERRGLPIIKIAELKAGVTAQTKFSDVPMPERYRVARGDILFSWSGNPDTSIDTFVWSDGPGWLNQHIFRVSPRRQDERAFVLSTLKTLRPVFAEIARNKQTTGLGHVTAQDMRRLLVVRPDSRVMPAWNTVASPLHGRIFQNELEIHELSTLRDTLLSKLTSGELRVKNAEAVARRVRA